MSKDERIYSNFQQDNINDITNIVNKIKTNKIILYII